MRITRQQQREIAEAVGDSGRQSAVADLLRAGGLDPAQPALVEREPGGDLVFTQTLIDGLDGEEDHRG